MISITRIFCSIVLFSIIVSSIAFGSDSYTDPDDQKAVLATKKAVERLGENGGGVSITFRSAGITYDSADITANVSNISNKNSAIADSGVSGSQAHGSNISGKIINIEKTLEDLNAKKVGKEIQLSLSGDILFDFDKWDIKPEAEETLWKIAGVTAKLKKKNIRIEGHTDSKGSNSYNLDLSRKRAESVGDWLLRKGDLSQIKFVTRGYGESRPVAPNIHPDGSDNPEGRAKNRRVEIIIK